MFTALIAQMVISSFSRIFRKTKLFRPYAWLLNARESGANAIRIGGVVVVEGANAIRIGGVVVVEVAVGVDIPEVRSVVNIRRTQPPPTCSNAGYNQLSVTRTL